MFMEARLLPRKKTTSLCFTFLICEINTHWEDKSDHQVYKNSGTSGADSWIKLLLVCKGFLALQIWMKCPQDTCRRTRQIMDYLSNSAFVFAHLCWGTIITLYCVSSSPQPTLPFFTLFFSVVLFPLSLFHYKFLMTGSNVSDMIYFLPELVGWFKNTGKICTKKDEIQLW